MTEDTRSAARAIIDGNLYSAGHRRRGRCPLGGLARLLLHRGRTGLVLGLVPEVTHSRNIAHEPRTGIVLHDSRAPARQALSPCI
ncbi:hypothetical protein [Streptomyces coeruleorubidus]|uniref:hypothetical protein n=1 Tax=Streptomyces coeruleorubidus TaxID=116188 RepID=UPI0033ECEF69